MKLKKIALNLVMLGFIFGHANTLTAATKAPDFTLSNSQGQEVKLSNYNGKFVVLEWFNDGCPYVQKHYKSNNMQKLQKKYTGQEVVWLTILSSAPGKQGFRTGPEINQIMKEKTAAPSQVLLDPSGKVGKLYSAKTTPHMFVLNPKGEIVYQGAIDSNRSSDPADIPGATNYVAQALDQALAGKAVAVASTVPYGCSVKYQ